MRFSADEYARLERLVTKRNEELRKASGAELTAASLLRWLAKRECERDGA